jgi:hypothetical protein
MDKVIKKIITISFYFLMTFSLTCCKSKTPITPSFEPQELASVIFENPNSQDQSNSGRTTFFITDRNILDVSDFLIKELSFDSNKRVILRILTPINPDSNKILIFFKSNSDTVGPWEDYRGFYDMYFICQNPERLYRIATGSEKMRFNGQIGVVFTEISDAKSFQQILIEISTEGSIIDTLSLDPSKNILNMDDFLKITKNDLPADMNGKRIDIKIRNINNNKYAFGCIYKFSNDNFLSVINAVKADIIGYQINDYFYAQFFAYENPVP